MLSIGRFVWAAVLFVNAVAVLNEERFLARSTTPTHNTR